jgi:hypothetical protein
VPAREKVFADDCADEEYGEKKASIEAVMPRHANTPLEGGIIDKHQ